MSVIASMKDEIAEKELSVIASMEDAIAEKERPIGYCYSNRFTDKPNGKLFKKNTRDHYIDQLDLW